MGKRKMHGDQEYVGEKNVITSEQQFLGIFLEGSVNMCMDKYRNLSQDKPGKTQNPTKEEFKKDLKTELNCLKDDVRGVDQNKINSITTLLEKNLDSYVDQLDKHIKKKLDDASEQGDSKKDYNETLDKVTSENDFMKISNTLRASDNIMQVSKDTKWKDASNLFKKMGRIGEVLSNFCDKKNEQAKKKNLVKSMGKNIEKAKEKIVENGKISSPVISAHSHNKQSQKGQSH